jgi:nitrate reductase NapE component
MPKTDYSWRDDVREGSALTRSIGWRLLIWILVAVAVIGAIGAVIWGVKVATSDVKGAGDATRITNDGRNRVNAQEWFHSQYAQIVAADKNLDEAAANLAKATTSEDKAFYQTNYTGLKNRCNEMVANYNAEANKVSRGKWLDPALPQQIDGFDTKTDCREAAGASPAAS